MKNLPIIIKNASENNLKNLSLKINKNKLIAFTGPSGSGKSTLLHEVLFKEARRQYFESFGYQFFEAKIQKPNVECIENLSPTLLVTQKNYNHNPRSTIGTVSEFRTLLLSIFLEANFLINKNQIHSTYFSSNHPKGMCQYCQGIGYIHSLDIERLIEDETLSINNGLFKGYYNTKNSFEHGYLLSLANHYNIDLNEPFKSWSKGNKDNFLFNENSFNASIKYKNPRGIIKRKTIEVKGLIPRINSDLLLNNETREKPKFLRLLSKHKCSKCNGEKYSTFIREISVNGVNFSELENTPFETIKEKIDKLLGNLTSPRIIRILNSIDDYLIFFNRLDLNYLSSIRSIPTLSSGEFQRVKLLSYLKGSLNNLIFIVDEITNGLHPKNIQDIFDTLLELKNKENTILCIEHNLTLIDQFEEVITLGPKGGKDGGYIVSNKKPLIDYSLYFGKKITNDNIEFFRIKNVFFRNLSIDELRIPLNRVICVTGVSGSGKSSLFREYIFDNFDRIIKVNEKANIYLKNIISIDKKSISNNSRSTIASFLDVMDELRNLYIKINNKYSFSLSNEDSVCQKCLGKGFFDQEIPYLGNIFTECETCQGKRFHDEVLNVRYKELNINEILNLSISDSIKFFEVKSKIHNVLLLCMRLGLGYLKLNQESGTLSGGEAQRIRLCKFLNMNKAKYLIILDEPSSGLSGVDLQNVIDTINELGKQNTVICIEHNLDLVSEVADYVFDMGSFGGSKGGKIVSKGTFNKVYNDTKSSIYNIKKAFSK